MKPLWIALLIANVALGVVNVTQGNALLAFANGFAAALMVGLILHA